ncbi:MAG: hypothetical protein CO117_07585, partial [Flavobacteriaceae bacterium CG_4_9_14_3_um_filter_33_16]
MTKVNRTSTGKFVFDGTGALRLPVGVSGQRPTNITEPGWIRFNTVTETIEFNDGMVWIGLASANVIDQITGQYVN